MFIVLVGVFEGLHPTKKTSILPCPHPIPASVNHLHQSNHEPFPISAIFLFLPSANQTITCPMKSFRIPVSTMKMTEEALDSALHVDTLLKASQFLDTFGSHVSNGRHLLGGIFFRTITMTSEAEVPMSFKCMCTILCAGLKR